MIVRKLKQKKYNELIEYCLKKSDYFSLTKYNDQHSFQTKNIIDYILNEKKVTKDEILNCNTDELICKLNKLYKTNKTIYKIKIQQRLYISKIELKYYKKVNSIRGIESEKKRIKEAKNIIALIEKNQFEEPIDNLYALKYAVENYKYNNTVSQFLEKNKDLIYSVEEKYGLWNDENELYQTIYKFKVNDETKKILMQNYNDIYDWIFPNSLEDLCFYRNKDFWFWSTSHEQECYILPDGIHEQEYFKSLIQEEDSKDLEI